MFKTLSAAALSLTLVLTSFTATPARADVEDVAKVLGGLALLYAIGRAVESNAETRRAPAHPPKVGHSIRSRNVIPAQCFREVVSRGEIRRGYGARCMQNNVRRAGALPPQCIRQVETRRGVQNLYAPRCLERNGWVRG
jgi:hypothetical protein